MDKEKLINRIRKDKIEIMTIPSTTKDQDRRKAIQGFAKRIEGIKTSNESLILFIHF